MDAKTNSTYSSDAKGKILVGFEADCPPDTSQFRRLDYVHPLQLTNWALAAAPGHPLLSRFRDDIRDRIQLVAERNGGPETLATKQELTDIGPLRLTGPAAITASTKGWLDETMTLRWYSLTGLYDGGKNELVHDVLFLPITGSR